MSEARCYEENSPKLLKTVEKALAKVPWELSLLSAGSRACISILPWGPRWQRGPKVFPGMLFVHQPLPRGYPAQNGISRPLFGHYSPFLFSIGSYPFFMVNTSGTMGPFPPSTLPAPTIRVLLGPGRNLGSSGCTGSVNR